MKIQLHGGRCCGIKHICLLGRHPSNLLEAKAKNKAPPNDANGYYNSPSNFYTAPLPPQKAIERFDIYLDYIKQRRKYGVIEVVLSKYQAQWEPSLIERGFKLVTECMNSNTAVRIKIYHLAIDKD